MDSSSDHGWLSVPGCTPRFSGAHSHVFTHILTGDSAHRTPASRDLFLIEPNVAPVSNADHSQNPSHELVALRFPVAEVRVLM